MLGAWRLHLDCIICQCSEWAACGAMGGLKAAVAKYNSVCHTSGRANVHSELVFLPSSQVCCREAIMHRHIHAASRSLGRALLQTPGILPTEETGPECSREEADDCFNPSVAKRWAIGALFLILFSSALGACSTVTPVGLYAVCAIAQPFTVPAGFPCASSDAPPATKHDVSDVPHLQGCCCHCSVGASRRCAPAASPSLPRAASAAAS
jgi:hypothetical protein